MMLTMLCVVFAAAIEVPETLSKNAVRPNILVILIDDMGYSDLATFGSPNASTPHIDALVASGMKFKQWISAASICTPSRASLQTGRYPIRTGCMGNVEKYRVIPTPANPGGLDPKEHTSLARAMKTAGYATGMSGKWHLGINGNAVGEPQDHRFSPNAHGYDTYLGAPYTNAPMCEMDADGFSTVYNTSRAFCFMTANDTVVQNPLRLENFTKYITDHALEFLANRAAFAAQPWYFFMSYFHVHTPLFTNRHNRGRSKGGEFGDNVEELDDSVGLLMGALRQHGFDKNTLIFLTADNGPYQEEGWDKSGRTNIYDDNGERLGRMKGGKGQLWEGGIRVPGAVVWPGQVTAGAVSNVMVSTMDIFPTALAAAGIDLGADYIIDGKDMSPVLFGKTQASQHDVFFHYCGFNIVAARLTGRIKVFWATPIWYQFDPQNASICLECCNGINLASELAAPASDLCDCTLANMHIFPDAAPLVYDVLHDPFEQVPLTAANWPSDTSFTYRQAISTASQARIQMQNTVNPQPDKQGAGSCTAGLPAAWRQPCCPGCHQTIPFFGTCSNRTHDGDWCTCDFV